MKTKKIQSNLFFLKLIVILFFYVLFSVLSNAAPLISKQVSYKNNFSDLFQSESVPLFQPIEDDTPDTILYHTRIFTSSVTIDNYGTWTVNPANPNFRAVLVDIPRGEGALTMEFLTLVGGQISYQGDTEDGYGGTMYVKNGIARLNGVNMMCSNACRGGALYVGKNTYVTLTGCTIQFSSATKGGCGVYIASGATVWMNSCDISSNTDNSSGANGAGIYLEPGATLYLRHTTISNGNITGNGGGIYNNGGTIYIQNSSDIDSNNACNGGGIYSVNGGSVIIQSETTVQNNNAIAPTSKKNGSQYGLGGGIYIDKAGTLSLDDSTIFNNTALYGGGIFTLSDTTTISDGTQIIKNSVSNCGGGIYNLGGNISVDSSQVMDNKSTLNGGGIYVDGGNMTLSYQTYISSNKADTDNGGNGGGIFIANGGNVSLTGGSAVGTGYLPETGGTNSAQYGGGVCVDSGTFSVERGFVCQNSASANGGGIYLNSGTINLSDISIISNDTARNNGGGIFASAGTINSTGTIFRYNVAGTDTELGGNGGGIFLDTNTNANINQSTIEYNSSASNGITQGGGVYNSGTLNVAYSTINNNTAFSSAGIPYSYGGGIANTESGNLTVLLSTICNNTGINGSDISNYTSNATTTTTASIISSTIADDANPSTYLSGRVYNENGNTYLLNSIIISKSGSRYDCSDICNLAGQVYVSLCWYSLLAGPSITLYDNDINPYNKGDLGTLVNNGGPTQTMALSDTSTATTMGTAVYYHPPDGPADSAYYYFYDPKSKTSYSYRGLDDKTVQGNEEEQLLYDQRGYRLPTSTPHIQAIGAYSPKATD